MRRLLLTFLHFSLQLFEFLHVVTVAVFQLHAVDFGEPYLGPLVQLAKGRPFVAHLHPYLVRLGLAFVGAAHVSAQLLRVLELLPAHLALHHALRGGRRLALHNRLGLRLRTRKS